MIKTTPPQFSVLLPDIRSGWNTGAFFRTADSLGVNHVFLSGLTPYPPHKEISKTALDADTFVPWTYFKNNIEAAEYIQSLGIQLVAMEITPHSQNIEQFEFPVPCCLVMGNEVTGIHKSLLEKCNATVHIPMLGKKQSMNVSIAGGIGMWEMTKKRERTL